MSVLVHPLSENSPLTEAEKRTYRLRIWSADRIYPSLSIGYSVSFQQRTMRAILAEREEQ